MNTLWHDLFTKWTPPINLGKPRIFSISFFFLLPSACFILISPSHAKTNQSYSKVTRLGLTILAYSNATFKFTNWIKQFLILWTSKVTHIIVYLNIKKCKLNMHQIYINFTLLINTFHLIELLLYAGGIVYVHMHFNILSFCYKWWENTSHGPRK